jgi:Ca2+-binding RTX toxin-like protein
MTRPCTPPLRPRFRRVDRALTHRIKADYARPIAVAMRPLCPVAVQPLHRLLLCIVAFSTLGAATAGSAEAFTVTLAGGSLTVTGSPSAANALSLTSGSPGEVLVADDASGTFSGPVPASCTSVSPSRISCPTAGITAAVVSGGNAADTLTDDGPLAGVQLDGGGAADTLYGGPHGDRLDGGDGDDTLYASAGADTLLGGAGADQLYGAGGDDTVDGGAGADQLFGGAGSDTLDAGYDADLVSAGDGADRIDAGAGNDTVLGDDGGDVVAGGDGTDVLDGGAGNDTLDGQGAADTITGDDGNDTIEGGDGDDDLSGGTGADGLDGGAGADTLSGQDGSDTLHGAAGDDQLSGGGDADTLDGEQGADVLDGGEGADRIAGGADSDSLSYEADQRPVTVALDGQPNDGLPGEGDDVAGDVERITGGAGDDTLLADDGGHALIGGPGSDTLIGGAAADQLDGGDGDDFLDGGFGADAITGAGGSDTISYASRSAGVVATLAAGSVSGEPGEGDRLDASSENVVGGAGDDTITGATSASNRITGGAGNDTILIAGDPLSADAAVCGTGADTVRGDRTDSIAGDCEAAYVDGSLVRPSAPPRMFVISRTLRASRSGGLSLVVRCRAATRGVCSGTAKLRFRSGRHTGTGSGRVHVLPGAEGRVTIRMTSASLRLLRHRTRAVSARVTVAVKDVLGRRTVRSITLHVRPPRRAG